MHRRNRRVVGAVVLSWCLAFVVAACTSGSTGSTAAGHPTPSSLTPRPGVTSAAGASPRGAPSPSHALATQRAVPSASAAASTQPKASKPPARPSKRPSPATSKPAATVRPAFPGAVPGAQPNTLSGATFAKGFWAQPVTKAPLAGDSAAIVANLANQVKTNYGAAAFNDNSYTTSLYTVTKKQQRQNVIFSDCQHYGVTPQQLTGPQGWFTAVPIPNGAQPSAGTDSEMTIWQPSTDTLWEFWQAHHMSDGWHACWGGRLDHASTSRGMFPGAGGATATGLPIAGGMVTLQDMAQGVIRHALSLVVVDTRKYPAVSWPAQRTDGFSTDPTTPVEGQRFRLDPTLDVSALGLTPLGVMVAKAAQKYGFVVMDKGGAVAVLGESGIPLQQATGTNPWTTLLKGAPSYSVLGRFPWDRLQALPLNYGK